MGYFQPLVIYRDENAVKENSILRYIGNRVLTKNANFLCAVVGATGAGKSYACLKMAEEFSRMFNIEFNPEHHVISSLEELLLLITEPEETRKIKFGSVIVFDEPQVEGNAKAWQSEVNKAIGQLISTFRNQRLVMFFAMPFLEMFDKQSRILFHGEFKVEGYDRCTKITTIKPRFLEWNKIKNDFYRKMLIIHFKEKGKETMSINKLNRWHISIASDPTLESYEKKKKKFTEDLNKRLLKQIQLSRQRDENKDKGSEFRRILELYEQYGEDYIKISEEMPHLNIFSIEKSIFLIKKSRKQTIKRTNIPKN